MVVIDLMYIVGHEKAKGFALCLTRSVRLLHSRILQVIAVVLRKIKQCGFLNKNEKRLLFFGQLL
jgi:hypothetical protein